MGVSTEEIPTILAATSRLPHVRVRMPNVDTTTIFTAVAKALGFKKVGHLRRLKATRPSKRVFGSEVASGPLAASTPIAGRGCHRGYLARKVPASPIVPGGSTTDDTSLSHSSRTSTSSVEQSHLKRRIMIISSSSSSVRTLSRTFDVDEVTRQLSHSSILESEEREQSSRSLEESRKPTSSSEFSVLSLAVSEQLYTDPSSRGSERLEQSSTALYRPLRAARMRMSRVQLLPAKLSI